MHLTNYAINKDSEGFVFNVDAQRDDIGHKRSLRAIFQYIDEEREQKNSKEIWSDIKDIIVKTLLTG